MRRPHRPRRRLALLLATVVAVALLAASCGADPTARASTTTAATLVDIGAGLQGPEGLTATVYAQGPAKLSAFAVDAQGRIWFATADASDPTADAVYLVPSAGATPVAVVDDVATPLGLVWHQGELYISSATGVDAYGGFDGTAFSTHRVVVALPQGTGESNGLALGADGRLYLGISAPCDHCTLEPTDPAATYSASVVSFLPDGTDLRIEASGIRAPVGLTFDPGTADLFVTMNQRDDLGDATPGDWLAVVEPGQEWGFPDCYGQGGTVCADQPAPVAELDPHAAVSGVALMDGQLGSSVGTSALVAEWSTGQVLRVALSLDGDTWTGTTSPFLTGLTNPVPLLTTDRGTVLVGDWSTGSIYEIAG